MMCLIQLVLKKLKERVGFLSQDSLSDYSRHSDQSVGSLELSTHNKVSPARKRKPLRTTNAYFYWVTREQGSFDWFKGVMDEVAELDQRVLPNASFHHHPTLLMIQYSSNMSLLINR